MERVNNKKKVIYTEDKILVFNLYLSKIPRAMSKSQIREHFRKFGNVLSVTIKEKRFHSCGQRKRNYYANNRYGFVKFETAESAAAALSRTCHMIGMSRIQIKAADSWTQPNIKLTERLDTKSILMLNDDCLFHIFSFLSLKEQVMLSTLCDRFKNILKMILRKKKALIVDFDENVTLMEIRQICHSVGHLIQEVHFVGLFPGIPSFLRYFNLIEHSCRELRWIEMHYIDTNQKTFYRRLSRTFPHLTKVELMNCDITDNDCFQLSKLSELEFLNVKGNNQLTGKYLADFPKLVALNLSSCVNIQSEPFLQLCSRNRNLKSLNICYCEDLNSENFYELAGQEHLEKLVIGTCYSTIDLSPIANLKNLKELKIFSTRGVLHEEFFKELAIKRSTSLVTLILDDKILDLKIMQYIVQIKSIKKLAIRYDKILDDRYLFELSAMPELTHLDIAECSSISNEGLIDLFWEPNKLEHVNIAGCLNINECALDPIVERMKEAKRTTACILYVCDTGIPPLITETDIYKENSSILQLCFDFPVKKIVDICSFIE